MTNYHELVEALVSKFDSFEFTHVPRAKNQMADALAILASGVQMPLHRTGQAGFYSLFNRRAWVGDHKSMTDFRIGKERKQ